MQLTKYKSNKLFYKKYTHKVVFYFNLSYIFSSYKRGKDLKNVTIRLQNYLEMLKTKSVVEEGSYRKIKITPDVVDDAVMLRDALLLIQEYTLVSDYRGNLIVYLNDIDTMTNFLSQSKTIGQVKLYEVNPILKNYEVNTLITKLAETYSFKVTLNIGRARYKNPLLTEWLAKNKNKIRVSDYAISTSYANSASVYIQEEKMLMLLQIAGGDCVQRIERLILPN
jgi:hypothetical protein